MTTTTRNERREFLILLGLSVILLFFGIFLTRSYLMDDTLITLRYSFNLARHGHAIWNRADVSHPSLGYTTVLWMLVNTVPAICTDNKDILVVTCKLIGLIPLAGIAFLLVRQISRLPVPFSFRAGVVAAIFSQVLYGFHLNSGMETLLFSCLALLAICTYAQDVRSILAYAFGTLALLTRPEGAILVALMLLWDLRRGRIRQAMAGCLLFTAVALALALVLRAEYGTVLPNAFYVKQGYGSLSSLKRTLSFIGSIALPFVLLTVYSVYRLKNTASRYCWNAAVVYTAYYLTVSPLMNVFWRYQWPILVLLTYASLPALQQLGQGTIERRRLALAALALFALIDLRAALLAHSLASSAGTAENNLIALGKAMARYRDGSKWLAYHDAGAVCYYSDWNAFDTMGLNTRQIATGAIEPAQVYTDRRTDLILQNLFHGGSVDTRDEYKTARGCQVLGAQLSRLGYQYAGSVPILTHGGNQAFEVVLFARNLPRAKAILQGARVTPEAPRSPLDRAHAIGGRMVRAARSWLAYFSTSRRRTGNA